MKYEKPEAAVLASALESVQTTTTIKYAYFIIDCVQGVVPITESALSPAYEADE